MKVSQEQLQRIIKEEVGRFYNEKSQTRKLTASDLNRIIREEYYNVTGKVLTEGRSSRPRKLSAVELRKIINEEYSKVAHLL